MKKLLLIAGLMGFAVIATACVKKASGSDLTAFAECVTAAGATFYGTEWCPHCKDQKALFGEEAMKKVNYIDCDAQKNVCLQANITGYPTWKYKDGTATPGTQPLESIAAKTNCTLPSEGTGTNA